MIIEKQEDVTAAVLAEMHRTPDARTKEILESLVHHLHGFVREIKMTEREFEQAVGFINAIGQKTSPSHNEAMLMAGALGISNLICLLNNGAKGTRETQANNLGPFWRENSPRTENGGTLLRNRNTLRGFWRCSGNWYCGHRRCGNANICGRPHARCLYKWNFKAHNMP